MSQPVVDAHVHFWDPARLEYPWLDDLPALRRPSLPIEYAGAMKEVPVEGIVFVEANPRADRAVDEVHFVEELANVDPRIEGIVAFVNLLDPQGFAQTLDALAHLPLVRGVRHNIQGNPPGFALRPQFVAGVRELGRHGLTFDLCATHDQLPDLIALAQQVEGTRMVLDHCGKPAIRETGWDPWAAQIREMAALPHVSCKISGLLTEADMESWRHDEVLPYAEHVVGCFGTERVMYGSDWPVLTLANRSSEWYSLTLGLTAGWSDAERRCFYRDNARRFYDL
jgi:L-fuconolactonase